MLPMPSHHASCGTPLAESAVGGERKKPFYKWPGTTRPTDVTQRDDHEFKLSDRPNPQPWRAGPMNSGVDHGKFGVHRSSPKTLARSTPERRCISWEDSGQQQQQQQRAPATASHGGGDSCTRSGSTAADKGRSLQQERTGDDWFADSGSLGAASTGAGMHIDEDQHSRRAAERQPWPSNGSQHGSNPLRHSTNSMPPIPESAASHGQQSQLASVKVQLQDEARRSAIFERDNQNLRELNTVRLTQQVLRCPQRQEELEQEEQEEGATG